MFQANGWCSIDKIKPTCTKLETV